MKQIKLGAPAPLMIYLPYRQVSRLLWLGWATFVVRTALEPTAMAAALRREIQAVDRDLPVEHVATMEQVVADSIAEPRFQTVLIGLFSALAVALAAVGAYGVMAYSVNRRTQEVGIRVALGAQTRDVVRMLLGEALILALAGVALGAGAALALTRVLANLLYGVGATDPATFLTMSAALVGVAVAAGYLPARRATRVDPMVALRQE